MPNADTFANSKGPGKETRRYGQYIEAEHGSDTLEPGDVVAINSSGEAVLAGADDDVAGYVYAITNDLVTIKAHGAGVASAAVTDDSSDTDTIEVGQEVGVSGVAEGSFDSDGSGWLVLDYTDEHPLSDVDGGPWVEVLRV